MRNRFYSPLDEKRGSGHWLYIGGMAAIALILIAVYLI